LQRPVWAESRTTRENINSSIECYVTLQQKEVKKLDWVYWYCSRLICDMGLLCPFDSGWWVIMPNDLHMHTFKIQCYMWKVWYMWETMSYDRFSVRHQCYLNLKKCYYNFAEEVPFQWSKSFEYWEFSGPSGLSTGQKGSR
jgi:hypothetical protein